jgi:hypothetical protein
MYAGLFTMTTVIVLDIIAYVLLHTMYKTDIDICLIQ